jgi:rsbT co-antagonist protein RsbR
MGMKNDTVKVSVAGFDVEWDVEKGINLWAGFPTLSMWIPSTVAGLMMGFQRMVGTERFNLCLHSGGQASVDGDWQVISQAESFEEGIKAISAIACTAGWGRWEVHHLDRQNRRAVIRAHNRWEGIYQKALGVCWGSSMLAGKFAGICARLFGTACWSQQTSFTAKDAPYDEFHIFPSDKTLDERLDALLTADRSTSADLAVALARIRKEVEERRKTEQDLREKLELIHAQENALRAVMATPIIQVWDSIITMPVVGTLDNVRATTMMNRLLGAVSELRARYAIVDLTGVEAVDTSTADHLLRIARAVQLLGARIIITGIKPAVAQTMVSLGLDVSTISTQRNLQEGLRFCMSLLAQEGAKPL